MADSVKGLGNVVEHCTHILLGVKGLIPLVKAVKKNSLS